jgi:anti-anti-sigma factor
MNLVGSSFFTVAGSPNRALGRTGPGPIIVWLQGEHDLSTDDALCMTLARAIALDDVGLVIDLSGVTFMGLSTLGVILRAQEFLRHRSQTLTLRSPSACSRRIMGALAVDDLLGPGPEELGTEFPGDEQGNALGTWVEVPTTPRGDRGAVPSPPGPEPVPVRGARAIDLRDHALSAELQGKSG